MMMRIMLVSIMIMISGILSVWKEYFWVTMVRFVLLLYFNQ